MNANGDQIFTATAMCAAVSWCLLVGRWAVYPLMFLSCEYTQM